MRRFYVDLNLTKGQLPIKLVLVDLKKTFRGHRRSQNDE